ncbi:MAG: hypothetical protein LBH60_06450 [Prevotellaceae bacterium]|jgi:hypothetical protein|nr:hypothetical protein [Prevotellaceae bacterium]
MSTKKLTDKKKTQETPLKKTKKQAVKPKTGKKKLVVSYKNLSSELIALLKETYPRGYSDYLIKVDKGNGDFFYAITLDTADADYLVKVDVKVDSEIDDVERALFDNHDSDGDFSDDSADPFPDDSDDE